MGGCCVDLSRAIDQVVDSLANFGLVGSQEVDLALNTEVVPRSDAGLGVLALSYQER